MKIRKSLAVVLTCLLTVFMLAGCGSAGSSGSGDSGDSGDSGSASGNTLVVYFSATGNTQAVAEKIADETGADLFEIQPKEEYTDEDLDYNDENSRVSKEHENESLQDVELKVETPDNWEDYDTVYLGYPIWWGGAAWPAASFVKSNDFSGKTVIPFCTSASSDIGSSAADLEEAAGTGTWKDGQRFSGGASEDEVKDWIDSMN
jgi:flavodoxin